MRRTLTWFAVVAAGLVTVFAQIKPTPGVSRTVPGQNKVTPPTGIKTVALTYPRRANLLHKGIGYKVTWLSLNLQDSKMKLELLNNQETTVVRTVGSEIDNTGQMMWYVDNLLPDDKTFYKLRIQTMDGAHQHTVGPFTIAKGTTPPGAPKLTVSNPGSQDRAAGDIIPVRWTTTTSCNTSQDGPVRNETFLVEQIDSSGKRVAGGMQGPAEFLGEGPTGYLNWQRKLIIGGSPGTLPQYSIRVTSRFGFIGQSPAFKVVVPTSVESLTFAARHRTACFYSLKRHKISHEPSFEGQLTRDLGLYDGDYLRVYLAFLMSSSADGDFVDQYVVRSRVFFHDDDRWYKGKGAVREAKLTIKRMQKSPSSYATYNPCLGGIAVLTENPQPDCSGWDQVHYSQMQPAIGSIAPLSGTVAVDTSTGDNWEVDLTEQYRDMVEQGKRDGGVMLFPGMEQAPDSGYMNYRNGETYRVELRVTFAKQQ